MISDLSAILFQGGRNLCCVVNLWVTGPFISTMVCFECTECSLLMHDLSLHLFRLSRGTRLIPHFWPRMICPCSPSPTYSNVLRARRLCFNNTRNYGQIWPPHILYISLPGWLIALALLGKWGSGLQSDCVKPLTLFWDVTTCQLNQSFNTNHPKVTGGTNKFTAISWHVLLA